MQTSKLLVLALAICFVACGNDCTEYNTIRGATCLNHLAGPFCEQHGDHGHCGVFECGDDADVSTECQRFYTNRTRCSNNRCQYPLAHTCASTADCNENDWKTACTGGVCAYPDTYTCQNGYSENKCGDEDVNIRCIGNQCVSNDEFNASADSCERYKYNVDMCKDEATNKQCNGQGIGCQAFDCWTANQEDNKSCKLNYQQLHKCNAETNGCTFNDAYECGDVNELESTKCNEHATRTACLNKKCVTPEEFAANGSVITFSVALAAFVLATLI